MFACWITKSNIYKSPGSTKNTLTIERIVPLPRNRPSCLRIPCVENPLRRNPTTANTVPDVSIDVVTEDTVSTIDCFYDKLLRFSRYLSVNRIA